MKATQSTKVHFLWSNLNPNPNHVTIPSQVNAYFCTSPQLITPSQPPDIDDILAELNHQVEKTRMVSHS